MAMGAGLSLAGQHITAFSRVSYRPGFRICPELRRISGEDSVPPPRKGHTNLGCGDSVYRGTRVSLQRSEDTNGFAFDLRPNELWQAGAGAVVDLHREGTLQDVVGIDERRESELKAAGF